jgi:signal transduction histidine kinase
VRGDEHRLEQVFTNLLSNAVRYSPDGGEITVSARIESSRVAVDVVDRGIGIAPDALERVFERFYRAEGVPESTGLGIGLYISRAIAAQHGGAIEVRSRLGEGSTFTVTLPLDP